MKTEKIDFSRFEGCTLKNGDNCIGEGVTEGCEHWFTCQDSSGNLYETREVPTYKIDMSGAVAPAFHNP